MSNLANQHHVGHIVYSLHKLRLKGLKPSSHPWTSLDLFPRFWRALNFSLLNQLPDAKENPILCWMTLNEIQLDASTTYRLWPPTGFSLALPYLSAQFLKVSGLDIKHFIRIELIDAFAVQRFENNFDMLHT
jgi:hypothetical protein